MSDDNPQKGFNKPPIINILIAIENEPLAVLELYDNCLQIVSKNARLTDSPLIIFEDSPLIIFDKFIIKGMMIFLRMSSIYSP